MYYFFAFVLLFFTNLSFAQDNSKKEGLMINYASFIMYHRFGENRYPSTNIKKEQFLKHINFHQLLPLNENQGRKLHRQQKHHFRI